MFIISTENQNEAQLVALLSFEVDGFSLVPCRGYFAGELENCIQIHFADTTLDRKTKDVLRKDGAVRIANLIADEFDQTEVLVVEVPSSTTIVSRFKN